MSIQSPEINQAVLGNEICANDQGMAYGYATNETKEYMPLPIMVAHKLMKRYNEFEKTTEKFFPDAKCQVSVEYDNNKPDRFTTILLSASHSKDLDNYQIFDIIMRNVIVPVLGEYQDYVKDTEFIINPSGQFTIWGSFGDSGSYINRRVSVYRVIK